MFARKGYPLAGALSRVKRADAASGHRRLFLQKHRKYAGKSQAFKHQPIPANAAIKRSRYATAQAAFKSTTNRH